MSVITIKIDTGELAQAIKALASAMAGQAVGQVTPTQTTGAPTQAASTPTQTTDASTQTTGAPTQTANTPTQTISEYTFDQLAAAATPLIDAGKQMELVNLLSQFGVQALTQLPKEKYNEFAAGLQKLGAKI